MTNDEIGNRDMSLPPPPESVGPRDAARIGAQFGLVVGFLDGALSLCEEPSGLRSLTEVFPPLAVTIAAYFIVFLFLIFALRLMPNSISPVRTRASILGWAGFVGMAFLAATAIRMGSEIEGWTGTFFRFSLAGCVFPLSILFYLLCRRLCRRDSDRGVLALARAFPMISALTMLEIWLQIYGMPTPASMRFALWIPAVHGLLYVGAVLAAIFAASTMRGKGWLSASTVWILFLATLAPISIPVFGLRPPLSGKRISDNPYVQTRRDIRHVILICVDTLRRDRLHVYNPTVGVTTQIDALAKDGILFKRAVAAAPWTIPSIASIMTAVWPEIHGLTSTSHKLPETMSTLAETMQSAGYFTAAIGDNVVLSPRTGIAKGWSEYHFFPLPGFSVGNSVGSLILKSIWPERYLHEATTDQLTSLALQWTKLNRRKDFFLWLHYFTPHIPYEPPSRYVSPSRTESSVGDHFDPSRDMVYKLCSGVTPDPSDQARIADLYDGEARYVDDNVGRFLQNLKQLGLYDDSLIIFTSDHGEELWDHGGFGHGHTHYNELLSVPLILKLPRSSHAGKEVAARVSTPSILPTIHDLCEIQSKREHWCFQSLTPLWSDQPEKFRESPVFTSCILRNNIADLETVYWDNLKFIRSPRTNFHLLFNLANDSGEKSSLADAEPELVRKGNELLDAQNRQAEEIRARFGWKQENKIELPSENLKKLKALGYIQ